MFGKFVWIMTLSLVSAFSSAALARHFVECGVSADDRTGIIKGFELAVYLEDRGQFTGNPGTLWNLQLGSERTRWIDGDRSIVASSERKFGLEIVEIQLNKTAARPLAIRYKLIDLWNRTPTLEKYYFGGTAEPQFVSRFECLRTAE